MPIPGPAALGRILSSHAVPFVFSRGKGYARGGHVVAFTSAEGAPDSLSIEGTVMGSRPYRTSFTLDLQTETISDYSCSCPYEDFCKHVVALGLVYADSLGVDIPASATTEGTSIAAMRARLESAGTDARHIPSALLAELVKATEKTVQEIAPTPKARPEWGNKRGMWTQAYSPAAKVITRPKKRRPFHERYDLKLSSDYRGYIRGASVAKRQTYHSWYSEPRLGAKALLHEETGLTVEQKKLLELVQAHEARADRFSEDDPTDHTEILIAARDAQMRTTLSESYHAGSALTWGTAEKLSARIRLENRESHDYNYHPNTYEYSVATLSLPRFSQKGADAVAAGEAGLVVISDGGIKLYTMPLRLAKIAARAICAAKEDPYRRSYAHENKRRTASADLADDEYAHINEILAAARECFDLDCPIYKPGSEPFEITAHDTKPVIIVDFQMEANMLGILPSLDYGGVTLPVADTLRRSLNKGQKKVSRRVDPAFGTTHVVRIVGTQIHIAPVDERSEREFFALGETHGERLGLTQRSRAVLRGEKQVTRYLLTHLPALKEYAGKQGYEIRYPHDIPDMHTADFRAEFDADVSVQNDWLAFDLALYCGEERVTLADIEACIERGDSLLKLKDGRILKITNPETVARLIELLAHFRKNGERFEGRVHHAPALDAMAKSSPHYSAKHSKDLRAFLDEATQGKAVKVTRIPAPFSKTLRPYQSDGVHWINFLRRYRFGGILADDMGLGKTIQALAAISMHQKGAAPSIVVAPKTLLHNWQHEAQLFAPHLKTLIIDGLERERHALFKRIKDNDLVITSYPALQRDIEQYEKMKTPFHYCVLDEAQYIKNPRTKSAHTVKRIPCEYRLALTGTPLENSVEELWSIFDFLMPGFLGHHAHFQKHFGHPIMKRSDARALAHLRASVQAFMLRRSKENVLKELPPKIEQTIECTLSDEQNILYQDVLARVKSDIFDVVKKKGFSASQIHILAGLTRLRQICNHPALVLPPKKNRVYPSAKLDALMDIVEEMRAEKRKILVFSQFTSMLDIIAKEFSARKIGYEYLSGKTKDRKGVVEAFTKGSATAFLLSTKVGGVGLNLIAADAVVIFDPWWNPQVERQAVDRTHRIGQTKSVHVFRLRTRGTIEEKIAALQERKSKLFDALVGESKDLFKKLTWDDVRGLLAG